ncbi:hypothetical protein ACNR91_000358 [Candidozyma auris]
MLSILYDAEKCEVVFMNVCFITEDSRTVPASSKSDINFMLFTKKIFASILLVSPAFSVGVGGACGSHADCDAGLACLMKRSTPDEPIIKQCVDGG